MKIVQVANHYSPCIGGMERVVEDIGEILAKKGHSVKVVCLNTCANSQKKLDEHETIGKIKVERIPYLNLKYYKIAFGVLGKIKEADVVHVHSLGFFADFLLLTKWFHKKRVVVSTHGGIFHTKNLGFAKKIYFNFFEKFVLGFADKVICVSKNDLELFSKISNNVALVENGVNLERFRQGKKKKNSFIFVGRFSRNKGVERLLEVFAEVKKSGKEFSLVIAGTDWESLYNGYVKKVHELGLEKNVSFILNPSQEETALLYSSSKFFVSASQYEGFGLTLVEAMASGCIPIVNSNAGLSAILGKNGFLADFYSGDAAKKIILVLQKSPAEKSALAKKQAVLSERFSWKKGIRELEKIYGDTIGG